MAIAILALAVLLTATSITARPNGFGASGNIRNGDEQQWQVEGRQRGVSPWRPKEDEDVGQEMEPPHAPADFSDTVVISKPPPGASVAEARPVATAIAGVGGVAASKPVATAIVGPAGLAVARPVAIAIAGVPLSPATLSTLPGLGGPVAASHGSGPPFSAPLHYGPQYFLNGYPLAVDQIPVVQPYYVYQYDGLNGLPADIKKMSVGPIGPATSHVRVSHPGKVEYGQIVVHSS